MLLHPALVLSPVPRAAELGTSVRKLFPSYKQMGFPCLCQKMLRGRCWCVGLGSPGPPLTVASDLAGAKNSENGSCAGRLAGTSCTASVTCREAEATAFY